MNEVRKCEVIIAHFGLKIDANLIGSIFLFFRPSLVKKEFKPTKLPRFDGPLREGELVWPRRASFLPSFFPSSLSFSLPSFHPPFLSPSLSFALFSSCPSSLSPSHPFALPFFCPVFLLPFLSFAFSSFRPPILSSFLFLPYPISLPFPSFLPLFFTLHSLDSFVILPFLLSTFLPFFHPFLLFFFPFFWSQRDLALCDSSIADCLAVVKMSRRGLKV